MRFKEWSVQQDCHGDSPDLDFVLQLSCPIVLWFAIALQNKTSRGSCLAQMAKQALSLNRTSPPCFNVGRTSRPILKKNITASWIVISLTKLAVECPQIGLISSFSEQSLTTSNIHTITNLTNDDFGSNITSQIYTVPKWTLKISVNDELPQTRL